MASATHNRKVVEVVQSESITLDLTRPEAAVLLSILRHVGGPTVSEHGKGTTRRGLAQRVHNALNSTVDGLFDEAIGHSMHLATAWTGTGIYFDGSPVE